MSANVIGLEVVAGAVAIAVTVAAVIYYGILRAIRRGRRRAEEKLLEELNFTPLAPAPPAQDYTQGHYIPAGSFLEGRRLVDGIVAGRCANVLNEMIRLDPDATARLLGHREICNARLAAHPHIQVDSTPAVGLLGVLNGLTETYAEHGAVAVFYDEKGKLLGAHLRDRGMRGSQ